MKATLKDGTVFEVSDETLAKIREAKKPELRHGDYGIARERRSYIYLAPQFSWPNQNLPIFTDSRGSWNYAHNDKMITKRGNTFDDLARNAEPLEKFEVKAVEPVQGSLTSWSYTRRISIAVQCGDERTAKEFSFDQIEEIAHKLLREVATARSKQ